MDINIAYSQSNLVYDRYFDEKLSLPFLYEDIVIGANEISHYNTINNIIDKLFANFLYIYGKTQFLSNQTPLSCVGMYGNYNNNISWFTNISSVYLSSVFNNTLDGITQIFPYVDTNGNFASWASSPFYVNKLNTNTTFTSSSLIYSTNSTDISSNYYFNDIQKTLFDKENNKLYVLDRGNNSIFKYTVTDNYIKNDVSLGGLGDSRNNFKFNSPTDFIIYNGIIYIVDSENFCIKLYDAQLTWKKTYNFKDISKNKPVNVFSDGNNLYIIDNKNIVYVLNKQFSLNEVLDLSISEKIQNVFYSKQNTNILYIVTEQNIYKRYISKLQNNVSVFQMYNFNINNTEVLQYAESCLMNGVEYIFVVSSTTASKILVFIDNNDYISVLSESNFNIFSNKEQHVNNSDYNQILSYNSIFQKIVYNHQLLQSRMSKKIAGNIINNQLVYYSTQYINNLHNITQNINYFIGANEKFSNVTINRCIKNIVNLQQDILNLIEPIILNTSKSLTAPVVIN